MLDIAELFEKHGEEYCDFDRIKNPPTKRADLCAFLLLDKLFPDSISDIVSHAEHDQIWLDADIKELANVATEDDIIYLIRCGVMLYEGDSLSMFA